MRRTERRDPSLVRPDLYDAEVGEQLWNELPMAHRQRHFTRATMPPEYLAAILENRLNHRLREKSVALNLRDLPEPLFREVAWCLHRTVELGLTIQAMQWNRMTLGLTLALERAPNGDHLRSLLDLSEDGWARLAQRATMSNPSLSPRIPRAVRLGVGRCQDLLVYRHHRGEWWQLDVWNPLLDGRIPLRNHEPEGRALANFSHLTTPWLREGVKWWLKIYLETGLYTWTSVISRLRLLKLLQEFIDEAGAAGPQLIHEESQLRPWCSRFTTFLRNHRVRKPGSREGEPMSPQAQRTTMAGVETFYRFMADNRHEAAVALDEPGWKQVGVAHWHLFRPGEKPRYTNRIERDLVLEDAVIEQIAAGAQLLAVPLDEGGLGDEQALRALLLLLRTGRRVNEILMLEFDPIVSLPRPLGDGESGFVAKLRYQQTKIFTGDPTILVDAEVVAIIRAQQEWTLGRMAEWGQPGLRPKYLFLSKRLNRKGLHPYPMPTLHALLGELGRRLDLKDSHGRPVAISRTHSFRHTKATNLLNAGVPLHVVMRYLGHLTPTMTMHYAKTLATTAEREFLRYRKVTARGALLEVDPRDLYDLTQLDKRADRILPNGLCLLPPRQVCVKGNACLTCTQFVTDGSYRSELSHQLQRTEALVAERQADFAARHGQAMPPDNIWLKGRHDEIAALRKIIASLDAMEPKASQGIIGAGAADRPDPVAPAR